MRNSFFILSIILFSFNLSFGQLPNKIFQATGTGSLPGTNPNIVNNNLTGTVTYLDGFYTWVVPSSGKYKIEAAGAQGGGAGGGKGAIISGEVTLTAGDIIRWNQLDRSR